ncbi:nuclear pore complex protein Nup153 isoform X2 [Sabethes cyaneus]|uniref:nuclear pore complex protein Nup153 isoform X2 n=1 Tax=Sabethes cyaneus TaxID=53552 RepID=UPI00237E7B34|nr:nuclear pore complex protein Nup153 isoform X2 [Sabethes cyaneus]
MFQARSRASRSSEGHPSQSPSMAAATTAAVSASGAAALNASSSSSSHNDSNLDDDPNNSIINKVRSRVSSILPGALSKWFSPTASKRPRDSDTGGGGGGGGGSGSGSSSSSSPTTSGRNGNLLRSSSSRQHQLQSRFNDAGTDGGSPHHLQQQQQQHHYQEQQLSQDDEEDDEDHAPPIRKRTRLDEEFNTSEADVTVDFGAIPGPSGLNISAIDRRGSLPACAQLPRHGLRNVFTSSTPSTSPQQSAAAGSQQQQQQQQQTNMFDGYNSLNRAARAAPFDFASAATAAESSTGGSGHPPTAEELHNESLSSLIRHRKSIREVSQRKRLNIPPMTVDRSTSEPPAAIFGSKKTSTFGGNQAQDYEHRQLQTCREDLVEEDLDQNVAEQATGEKVLSNGNLNESASESSSISNLNLSQNEHNDSRRLSGFMGNNRSKRYRVGGSTGDLCFSSHLETEKSLFSTKNTGARGSGRPTFNASIYGSTSSLGSSNSSLFANSPFYNGRTMYGGASAYAARRDSRQKALRVPVQIRPSSSLSNFSNSSNVSLASDTSALSSTAKRILEIMNQCSGPLNEARKLGSSLSLNSTLASAKVPGLVQARKRFNEEDLSINRSIRMSSPRTPYSRPISATGSKSSSSTYINKPPTAELLVPTTSQLLQMKRLQSNTESVRRLATESAGTTVLNQTSEYKLPAADGADDSNNNVKHTGKMRNKLNRIREESLAGRSSNSSSSAVGPIDLPEVQLTGLKSVPKFDIKLPISSGSSSNGTPLTKASDSVKDSLQQKTSGDSLSSGYNSRTTIGSASPLSSSNNLYKFSAPTELAVSVSDATFTRSPKVQNHFKFSDPEPIGSATGKVSTPKTVSSAGKLTGIQFDPLKAKSKLPASPVVPVSVFSGLPTAALPLKSSGSCLEALKSPVPKELKSTSCLEALAKPTAAAAPLATSSPASGFGNAFKLTGSNKWECDACMVRNDPEKMKCVACETPKPGAQPAAVATAVAVGQSKSAPAAVVADSGFKALAAQQSAKWECSTCMTRNDTTLSKCACCEQAKPGSAPTDAPSFSFGGSKPAAEAKFSFGIPAGAKPAGNDAPSSGFTFGAASGSSISSSSTSTGGFTFGAVATSTTATASSAEVKPSSIFGTSSSKVAPATEGGFSFGVSKPIVSSDAVDSSKDQKDKKDDKPVPSFGSAGGFSFGAKPAAEAAKKSETITSTTTTTAAGFSFGSSAAATTFKLGETPKTGSGFSFGKPATEAPSSSVSTTSQTPAVATAASGGILSAEKKPAAAVAFSSVVSSSSAVPAASSTPPPTTTSAAFSFGTPTESSSKPAVTVASGMFSFGTPKTPVQTGTTGAKESPAATAAASAPAPAANVPIFGGAQKATGPSITPSFSFGASTAGGSSGAVSSTTMVAATTTATVSPSFSFGASAAANKPAITNTTSTATPVSSTSAATSFVFGQSQQAAAKPVAFGVVSPSGTSLADKSTTFGGFGANAPSAPTGSSIFGGVTAATSSGFSFGGSAATPAAKPTETPTQPAFSFGGANKSSAPVFGAGAVNKSTIFGSPSTGVTNNNNSSPFGAFGSGNSNTSATFGSSTFGAASPSASTNTGGSIFGQTPVPAFAAPSGSTAGAAPTFGAAPTGFGTMTAGPTSNLFGVPSTTPAPTADEPQPKKPFEFGSNTTVNSQSAAPFQFGAASNNNNNNDNGSKPFSFSAHSAPNFNFTAGSNAGQSSAPFTFGGQNQNVVPTAQHNPGGVFNFGGGGGGGVGLSAGSGLGGMAEAAPVGTDPAAVAAAAGQSPAFQFGAGSATMTTQHHHQQNPFAATSIPGQATAQQQQRRKLRATRRVTPR